MTSHVLGVKDQVIVALLSNKLGGGIFSKSEIKRPEDLKGKLIATGRPGALNDILVRYVLTRKWGLSPDRDVKLMPIGEPPLMMQALERGVVDATSLSVPASFVAKSKGFSSWSTMTTSAWPIRCTLSPRSDRRLGRIRSWSRGF